MSQRAAIRWLGFSITMHIEALGTQPRAGVSVAFTFMALCWAFLLTGAGTGMDVWVTTTWQIPPHDQRAMMAADWTMVHAIGMVFMWWAMMLAMMLPGVLLAATSHLTAIRLSAGFLAVYGMGWLGFSLLATALQFAFEAAGWLDAMRMWSISSALSYALLAVVAGTQISLLVQALRRIPAVHEQNRRSASRFTAGCLISTAPVMLLLFVGGIMNLVWIVGLSIWAAVQKTRFGPVAAPAAAILICLFVGANIYLNSLS